jgi:hypothetical protein
MHMKEWIDINTLNEWMRGRQKTAIYHVGFLANDRYSSSKDSRLVKEEKASLNHLASTLYKMAMKGEIALAQRRLSEGRYEYQVQKV